jgi:VWFA-related protein
MGAQVEGSLPRDPHVITVDVEVVNILCTVRDRRGAFVNDLTKDDFRIREDGQPQEIRYFTREVNTPITVALLLDVSGSVSHILDIEKTAASRFFAEVLRPTDRALFVTFAETVAVWQDLTSDLDRLNAALQSAHRFDASRMPEFRAHGGTLLHEAVNLVAAKKLSRVAGRKAIVVITDGLDNGSVFASEAAVKAAQDADAIIYAIHYLDDGSPAAMEHESGGEAALRKLAEPTGGRMFHVGWGTPLKVIFNTIREEMRNQYAIGYTSTNHATDGRYRRIELKTAQSGVKVQARQGYYR